MKRIFVLAALIFITASGFAQTDMASHAGTGSELSIGVDGGFPIGDFKNAYNFGIGGTVKYAYNIDEVIALTLQSGYISFSGKTFEGVKLGSFHQIPLKVGARYTFGGGVYLEPQLGASFIGSSGYNTTAFTYAINLGYKMTPGVDVSARYEGMSKNGTRSFIGLRVAYSFPLGSK